jgi:K+-sensing histidine kinase KdpD
VGLGLYTVQKYTALLKGTIQGESRAGKGSTFTLRIPCEPKKSPFVHEQLSFPSDPEDSSGGAG